MVENVFGGLKALWRRLMKRKDMLVEHIPTVVAAACILHNVCEIHGEHFNEAWLQDIAADQGNQPSAITNRDGSGDQPTCKCVREALVEYIRRKS